VSLLLSILRGSVDSAVKLRMMPSRAITVDLESEREISLILQVGFDTWGSAPAEPHHVGPMSRTSLRSNTDLPPPSDRRVPHPNRGDSWNALADIEVFVFAVEAELEAMDRERVGVHRRGAYYAFVSEDGHPVSVSVCDSREAASRSNDRAGAWVAANMRDLIPDPPEVLLGPILADAATLDEEVEQRRASQAEPWVDGGV
jgi:hypothetical protein